MKILTVLMLAASLFGCKPDDDPPVKANPGPPYKWVFPLQTRSLSSTPFYVDGNILFGHPAAEENNYLVYSLNAETGDNNWVTRIVTEKEFLPFDLINSVVIQDKLIIAERPYVYVLDISDGHIVWSAETEYNFIGMTVIDGFVYLSEFENQVSSSMYRYNIQTGMKEKLFTLRRGVDEPVGDFTPYLRPPVKWIHPGGDEILVLQNRSYGHDKIGPDGMYGYSKMDLMAYNLTADSILWYRYEVDNFSSQVAVGISGDNVYFYGDHHAYCIHAGTGETLWKYFIGNGPEDDFNTANILLIGDKLIVKPDNDHMHAVNKESGERIWLNEHTASMPGLLTVHNDTIWFASGGILAIDAHSGETLIDQWNNDDAGSWIFPIAHHPEKPWIYTSDASYFYCLDIRKLK